MKMRHHNRVAVLWGLLACLLLSGIVCGFHHGQMSGAALKWSGLNAVFCSTGTAGELKDKAAEKPASHLSQLFASPICAGSVTLASHGFPAANGGVSHKSIAPIVSRSRAQPPPRYVWPSLNPRAPPAFASL